ncbi:hypothetical protein PITCH_A1640038 [uncultured Desulfobacterium sp.]|uniref:Uncharacterized protein n=1 Tax=uncultured Desulfobacterium sp. TaxID=201089 RepID=A0A445MU92_9BACT|nr:hypothetical protein PITCH_A1640038 [uncultured Desulfobacterium sp.]
MEKRNLGRGLEDISNIFLSTAKKADDKGQMPGKGFSAVKIRDDTCASCIEMIEGSSKEPKCRIFTVEDKKYGVPHLETITMNYANYCGYFTKATQKETSVANDAPAGISGPDVENCEIEEIISIRKKITFQDTEATKEDIKRTLLKYLDEGYNLTVAELTKVEESSEKTNRQSRKEEISLLVEKR